MARLEAFRFLSAVCGTISKRTTSSGKEEPETQHDDPRKNECQSYLYRALAHESDDLGFIVLPIKLHRAESQIKVRWNCLTVAAASPEQDRVASRLPPLC